ncbi:MAG: hypothetical protein K2X73_09845 [Sphingomonas sp.]|jgi:hypothetical protein|uniref:hypothetical protein n=1 Tax=Sphingomonas sp. TaxID=28214 RepID=UPI0025DBE7EE|nr:hypothetical protein [Sphingomonas sp.]MBX9882262.1 hypothetical protein [Sphingomonas sp.]
MTSIFDLSLAWQRQLLDVQRAFLSAGEATVAWQEASRRATEANVAAMASWARLWGGR